jgi:DNA helicase-2/ATP-dependent DNA helicase PcrA
MQTIERASAAFQPTKQQQDVLEKLQSYFEAKLAGTYPGGVFSIFLSAVAGSGKTSTIMLIAGLLNRIEKERGMPLEWCSLSFNRPIMLASNKKYREHGYKEVARTTNSLGRSILVAAAEAGLCRRPGKLNKAKYSDLAKRYCSTHSLSIPQVPKESPLRESEASLAGKIRHLVSAARLTNCEPNEKNLLALIKHYPDLRISPMSPYWPFIWQAVRPIIRDGIERYNETGEHDFDDQIFLPVALDVAAPIFDVIAVDEAQDLNKVRTELVKRSIKPDGALIFVGDRRQAIQGFAFADTESVDNIIRDTRAVEMPLTCCWRCARNIIRLAQEINAEIEARPNADDGLIEQVSEAAYIGMLQPGYYHPTDKSQCREADMVVCRIKADLVKGCLAAIRAGKYAIVRGRDIGRNVIALLEDVLKLFPFAAYDMARLDEALHEYHLQHVAALAKKKDAEEEIEAFTDLVDTLEALIDGYKMTMPARMSMSDLTAFIESKFEGDDDDEDSQREGPRPVVFSTIHKAKGLETDRVFILRGDLMPHPAAIKSGKAWQVEQEFNVLYVAVTRAKHELYFVGKVPASLEPTFTREFAPPVVEAPAPVIAEEPMIITEEAPAPKHTGGRPAKDRKRVNIKLDSALEQMTSAEGLKARGIDIDRSELINTLLWKFFTGTDSLEVLARQDDEE